MESYPKFHNEVGVSIVRIGCREFKCIGDKPPQDHPHIYLKMGDAGEIVCPYCSTLFRFDPSLGAVIGTEFPSDPAAQWTGAMWLAIYRWNSGTSPKSSFERAATEIGRVVAP
jgi:uncharacterized Zn-finger protein